MSRKVCVLRCSAEIEALAALLLLKDLVIQHHLTEAEALAELERYPLPDCAKHHHLVKREARRQEGIGLLAFVPGWGEQYAQDAWSGPRSCRTWRKRFSGPVEVMQLVER